MFVLVVARLSSLTRLVAVTRARGEARFRSLVHNATDVIIVVDANGVILYTSPAIGRIWHHRSADVLGTPFARLLHPDDVDRFTRSFDAALASDTIDGASFDGRIWSSAQHWRSFEALTANLLDDPSVNGVVLTCRDVTERVALEAQLTHQAFHDPLTGLANRALFLDRVAHALGRLARRGRLVAVLFIDLDDFKTVNDGLGHSAGDTLLREVGVRLTSNLRPGDTAARLGGDEFAVLVEDAADQKTITAVAERLITAIEQPFAIGDATAHITTSIGIATRATSGAAPQLLIRDADLAMYDAKTRGKGCYAWFDPAMRVLAVDRWELRTDLADALSHGELFLMYQPIVDLADGHIAGAEALLRWRHPTRGTIAPVGFVPIAEQSGMITEIGDWVLRTATREAGHWQDTARCQPYISVNVSAVQLRDHAIVGQVHEALAHSGLPAGALTLELTESTLMDDVERSRAVFLELKDLGVSIAVDDFGTGYSSLAYLRQLPVDVLKIDKSFVNELGPQVTSRRSLAQDIISLARALDLTSIAEGIETPEQLTRLQAMNCTMGQGYHFARPMDSRNLARQLRGPVETPV
jgi:diguanylate cyclase (GGDEF)-like protein/PAS domain S-box-containing protein